MTEEWHAVLGAEVSVQPFLRRTPDRRASWGLSTLHPVSRGSYTKHKGKEKERNQIWLYFKSVHHIQWCWLIFNCQAVGPYWRLLGELDMSVTIIRLIFYQVSSGAFWSSCGVLSIFKPQVRNKWSKYTFYIFYLFWILSWMAPPPDLFEILSRSYFRKSVILQGPQERNQGWHKQMERYTMFLYWKNQYSENDYTTQRSLQIQCNPYQSTNGIIHRIWTNNFTICMETQKKPE